MLSLLGAMASAPTDWVSLSFVREIHVPDVESYVQMPPWAAPRIRVPSLRMTSAPIRPDTASNVLLVRPTWTIGLGPWLVQVPPRAAPRTALLAMVAALALAFDRSWAAWSSVMGLSPDSSRLQ